MTYQLAIEALADGTRRKLYERLGQGPESVGALARGLPVSRPAVSQHLGVLKRARLVCERRQGRQRFYRIDLRGLRELRAYLERFWDDALAGFAAAAIEEGRKWETRAWAKPRKRRRSNRSARR